MTRETKIGLLIGLGFIVVFAVLLSHTGSVVPAGDTMPVAINQGDDGPVRDPSLIQIDQKGTLTRSLNPHADRPATETSSQKVGLGERVTVAQGPSLRPVPSLKRTESRLFQASKPEPKALDGVTSLTASGSAAQPTLVGNNQSSPAVAPTVQPAVPVVQSRIAPPKPLVIQPKPAPAADKVEPTDKKSPEPKKLSPPARQPEAKTYVVQKGDTVRQIVRTNYGSASKKKIEFFLASNKGKIKNKDMIVEGQELKIPALPPEMFEAAPGFDVSQVEQAKVRTVKELLDSAQRVAPKLVKNNAATRMAGRYREYEIQAKDTLSSIASRELGSMVYWREIQKLNPNIDPKKMRPGTKIKLPTQLDTPSTQKAKRAAA